MNGFTIMADDYRELVKQGKIKEEDAIREIKVYDFLGSCDQSDFYRLIDSSAFNEIIKAFCKKAMKNVGLERESISKAMAELEWLFDTTTCRDVCEK